MVARLPNGDPVRITYARGQREQARQDAAATRQVRRGTTNQVPRGSVGAQDPYLGNPGKAQGAARPDHQHPPGFREVLFTVNGLTTLNQRSPRYLILGRDQYCLEIYAGVTSPTAGFTVRVFFVLGTPTGPNNVSRDVVFAPHTSGSTFNTGKVFVDVALPVGSSISMQVVTGSGTDLVLQAMVR